MKITRSNRFNCSKRLEGRANVQGWVLNLISLFTIAAGIAVLGPDQPGVASNDVLIGTVVIGLSVLGILIGFQAPVSGLLRRAVDSHQCGREISHVYRRLANGEIDGRTASEEYEQVISRYSDNHDPCDYAKTLWLFRHEIKDQEPRSNWITGVVWSWASQWTPVLEFVVGAAVIWVAVLWLVP